MNLMPQWIQDFAKFNPVNWAVEAGRQTLSSALRVSPPPDGAYNRLRACKGGK